MKFPLAAFILTLFCSLTLLQCKGKDTDQQNGVNPDPNETVGEEPALDTAMQGYESPDRVIWQKPELVIEQLGDVTGKTVADLGAGTGYFSRRIAYKGARVIAIDIDPRAIQWMQEQKDRFPIELQDRLIIRKAEPNDPKLRPNEVDMVLLVNTYSYIENRVAYFSNLQKAIRKGGTIVIIDFKKMDTPFGPKLEERLDVHVVESELQQAGYQIVNTDESALEYQYIIKAVRP